MPADPLLLVLLVAIGINVVLVLLAVAIVGRRGGSRTVAPPVEADAGADRPTRGAPRAPGQFGTPAAGGPVGTGLEERREGRASLVSGSLDLEVYDRVVRVVSWAVILATATIVAVSGQWPQTQSSIFVLLAMTGLFVLTIHELVPASLIGSARYVVEGSVGLTVATLLVTLTDGAASPFFFTFLLIVAGAALVLTPRLTVAIAAIASGAYLVAVLADAVDLPIGPELTVLVGANIVALVLVTYVALVVAAEQRRSRDAAIELSTVDSLTDLYNRAYFFAATDREIQRSERSGRRFSLLMMDLDGLKPINDRFGHFQGDRVLRGVGGIIASGVRRIDTAARYGGDEFVVLLPETDPEGAYTVAEKIRLEVTALAIETPVERIRTSLSIGIVTFPTDGRTADELMISADQAMYASKRWGRNRIVGYRPRRPPTDPATRWTSRPPSVPAAGERRDRTGSGVGSV